MHVHVDKLIDVVKYKPIHNYSSYSFCGKTLIFFVLAVCESCGIWTMYYDIIVKITALGKIPNNTSYVVLLLLCYFYYVKIIVSMISIAYVKSI